MPSECAVALALCSGRHDPDWECRQSLDTASMTQLASWTRSVLAQTRGEQFGDKGG